MCLARTDQARDDNQPAGLDNRAHLTDQRALVLSFIIAEPVKGPCQPEMRLHVGEHQFLPVVLKCSRTRKATVSRSSVSASNVSMKARSDSGKLPRGRESCTEMASLAASGVGNATSAAGSGNGVRGTVKDTAP